jgi:hypothetical protein
MKVNKSHMHLDHSDSMRVAALVAALRQLCDVDDPLANAMRPLVVDLFRAMPGRVRSAAKAQIKGMSRREARTAMRHETDPYRAGRGAAPSQEDSLTARFEQMTEEQQEAFAERMRLALDELEAAAGNPLGALSPEEEAHPDQARIDAVAASLLAELDL